MRRAMGLSVALLAALGIAAGAASGEGETVPQHLDPAYLQEIDDARIHGTITPPGADTRHATAEIEAYDSLVQDYPTLTEQGLGRYFKLRTFGPVEDPQRSYRPREDVTVVRDTQWGEPKIFGETDEAMAFGAGFTAAEDRLAIMELLRALGRAEAFELLGTVPAWLADMEIARLYGYTEGEWQEMIDRLPREYGQDGADAVRILEAHVEGINEYIAMGARGEVPLPKGLADLGVKVPAPWSTHDVVAVVSIVRALFGAGGGSELNNASVLANMVRDFGPERGRAVYEDFRNRDNADGPVHTTQSFPYMERSDGELDPAANTARPGSGATGLQTLLEDLGDLDPAELAGDLDVLASRAEGHKIKLRSPLGMIDLTRDAGSMSNHAIVDGERSSTGHPILIGGPQAGYFSPQILMDYELHSPTIHARGAGFPGLSTLVVMGRTQDYAWTPTAGGSDMIDTYVEKLCNPSGGRVSESSRHYEFDGECVAMDRRTYRSASEAPAALRDRLPDIVVERTVHGPVYARGKLGDVPVAISKKRSTYLKELDPAVSILKMNRNEAQTGDEFVDIFRESHNLSTNWGYASDDEIAYVHGGLYPRRPRAVDPDLPVWGTGEWEWAKGSDGEDEYLGRDEVPHEVNPDRGYVISWNNRPAPGWGASDAQWGWSSLYRADLLEDRVLATGPGEVSPVKLVQIMEEAGLTDLRGSHVAPLVLRLLEQAGPLGPREQRMTELLREWIDAGALRRDGDGDGDYDHSAAVAIMDALWEPLIREALDPVLGDASRIPLGFDNAPGAGGSAYQSGFYGYLWTDFSQALGDPVGSPSSQVYCGGAPGVSGDAGACAARVRAALEQAGDALESSQRTGDPDAWEADAEGERIRFLPAAALSMHWVNRPTTQQIAMFGRRP